MPGHKKLQVQKSRESEILDWSFWPKGSKSTSHCILFAKIDWFWGQLNKTISSVITRLEIISGESLDMRSSQIHFSLVTYHFWAVKLIT